MRPEPGHGATTEQTDLTGAPLPAFDQPIRAPRGPTPLRRPGSVRRTMTLDAIWPEGRGGVASFVGVCRDVRTGADGGPPQILALDRIEARVDDRTILSIRSEPARPALARLAGLRAGGQLRAAAGELMPAEKRDGAPVYLLLDDLAGATLVSGWAWALRPKASALADARHAAQAQTMEGVCIGFRPGSTALLPPGTVRRPPAARVSPLANPADPEGWHPVIDRAEMNVRRARWIDLWREDGAIHVESGFQDSASAPEGGARAAVHEYRLTAQIDAASGILRMLEATPGTLPYPECRAAPVNLPGLIGAHAHDLRLRVLEVLRRTNGCTHLNDMLRALAEVPGLARHLG